MTAGRPFRRFDAAQRGFTLVELLVAVLVFGLLAAAAYAGLNGLARSADSLQQRAGDLAELQRAVAGLDQDLRQLVSRAAPAADRRTRPALAGEPTGWIGHRAGRWSPDPGGITLQTVAWSCLDDGRLQRRGAPGAAAELPAIDALARNHAVGCRDLRFRYRDPVGQWTTRWPVGGRPEQLPSAIEYVLDTERFGEIRRLVAL